MTLLTTAAPRIAEAGVRLSPNPPAGGKVESRAPRPPPAMTRLPHLLALASAVFSAFAAIFIRQGLRGGDPQTGFGINLLVGAIGLWTAVLLLPAGPARLDGIVLFALSGLIGTFGGRLFRFLSIDKVGAAVSSALIGLSPFVAAGLAIGLLGEPVTLPIVAGTVVIVAGTILLTASGRRVGFRAWHVILPLLSATCFGAVAILRKLGVGSTGPVLGFAVTVTTALALFLVVTAITRSYRRMSCTRRSLTYFVGAGVAENVSVLLTVFALKVGHVSVVTPLTSAAPLFVLVLAPIFLGDVEPLTLRVIVGTVLIVLGVYAITLF